MASYYIIGSDGKQYGPIASEDLRKWIAEARVTGQTQAAIAGGTEWRTLSEFPEFADMFGAYTPPPLAGAGKTSGLAIASLVLGICGLVCGITAVVGLVLGFMALGQIKKSNGVLKGKGMATAGIIISAIMLLAMITIVVIKLIPATAKARDRVLQSQGIKNDTGDKIQCINHQKQLSIAFRIYAGDHANTLPPAASWCDAIKPNVQSDDTYKCPSASSTSRCDFAFNSKLGKLNLDKVNPQTVLLFESDKGWNGNGGSDTMISTSRHGELFVVAFVDGSVQQLTSAQIATLRWDP